VPGAALIAPVLLVPSNWTASALQTAPVTGTQAEDPEGRPVATTLAIGGTSVIVSVTGAPGTTPGMLAPVLSTKTTLLIVNV